MATENVSTVPPAADRIKDLPAAWGVSISYLRRQWRNGAGPRRIRLSRRLTLVTRDDFLRWLEAKGQPY
jgi:hypothetical protein